MSSLALSASPNPERWLWRFLVLHVVVWTLVHAFTHLNMPLDALEGATWGHQLELGYDKNPFLNGWLTALVVWLSGHTDWAVFLTGVLCTAICFWAVYRLGSKFLHPWHALVAVMLLEGMQYYNLSALDLNDNVLEIALWPLMALSFYRATSEQRWQDWLLCALWSALATMAKYYVVVILLPMLLFVLINPKARVALTKPAFYLAMVMYLVLIAPHFIWLYQHQGITIDYALIKTAREPNINPHIHYVVHFTLNYLAACLLPLLLFSIFCFGKSNSSLTPSRYSIDLFDKQFLGLVGFGPFGITLLLSILFGWALHTGWGASLPALWGLGLLALTQPRVNLTKLRRFGFILALVVSCVIGVYSYSKVTAGDTSSANYPGRTMALTLTQAWHQQYGTKLRYVAGPRWEAGNVAYYSPDQPAVYMEWNQRVSPWIDEQKLLTEGAIFIWPEAYPLTVAELKQRFPTLQNISLMHFSWQRYVYRKPKPLAVWVGYLPPAQNR